MSPSAPRRERTGSIRVMRHDCLRTAAIVVRHPDVCHREGLADGGYLSRCVRTTCLGAALVRMLIKARRVL